MSTTTTTLVPLIGALKTAHEFKNQATGNWIATNEKQADLLSCFYKQIEKNLGNFSSEELKYLASFSHEELNAWLAKNGFDISLSPFKEKTDFGAASILDVCVNWISSGKKSNIEGPDAKNYAGVILLSDDNDIEFKMDTNIHAHPVARIPTQNGDTVCMTIADDPSCEGLALMKKIMCLNEIDQHAEFQNINFPMLDVDDKPNISWLKKMFFQGVSAVDGKAGEMTIVEALQQTRFKMNCTGARVKSAVAIGMMRCASVRRPPPMMIVDKPFYLWIDRNGVEMPYFSGYFDSDCWKDPGSLVMPGDKA